MSEVRNVFTGELEKIALVDIDAPIKALNEWHCGYHEDPFYIAAKAAEDSGDAQLASIFRFVDVIVGFSPNFDNPTTPYNPYSYSFSGDMRSAIPSDLTLSDVEALRLIAPLAKNPALRARLFDILWLRKDHHACAEACDSYLKAAAKLDTPENWVEASQCYKRALQLASKLGRDKNLYTRVSKSVQAAARQSAEDTNPLRARKYLRLIQQHWCGEPEEFALIAESIAGSLDSADNPYHARAYWEVAADLYRNAKDVSKEKIARLAAAETYVAEARIRVSGKYPSALAAAGLMMNAIEALRRAGAPRRRVTKLRRQLSELQQASAAEMKTIETELDISDSVERAREHVHHSNLRVALFRFTLCHKLIDCDELKETVIKSAAEFQLQHTFGTAIVDAKGRVTKQKAGLIGLTGKQREERLLEEMFTHASQFMWPLRAQGFIEPGRLQIYNDHHPDLDDLAFLVSHNPFIPPGHESVFLRGIHSGFQGDFLVASCLLVPQIENSLRYVLETQGVDVSNLNSDGTQPVKVLGGILSMKETKKIFGDSICFELRCCLIEKSGYDFRNRIAHGFASEADCHSVPARHIWWLVMRICISPIYAALKSQRVKNTS